MLVNKISTKKPLRVTEDEYRQLLASSTGICLACGAHRGCTEPDAEQYDCENCEELRVYGLEVMMVEEFVVFVEREGSIADDSVGSQ